MKPILLENPDMVFKAPAGVPDCGDLTVMRIENPDGWQSVWKVSPVDLAKIMATRRIYLTILGNAHPVVALDVTDQPVDEETVMGTEVATLVNRFIGVAQVVGAALAANLNIAETDMLNDPGEAPNPHAMDLLNTARAMIGDDPGDWADFVRGVMNDRAKLSAPATRTGVAIYDARNVCLYAAASDDMKNDWDRYAEHEARRHDEAVGPDKRVAVLHQWTPPCSFESWFMVQHEPTLTPESPEFTALLGRALELKEAGRVPGVNPDDKVKL